MNKTSRTRSKWDGRSPAAALVSVALCMMTISVTVIAHHYRAPAESVRFRGTPWRDYGVLPPMPKLLSTKTKEMRPADFDDDSDDEAGNEWSRFVKRVERAWTDADIARSRGDLRGARRLLHDYISLTDNSRETAFYVYGVQDVQQRRNSAIDQLDALAALDHGSSAAAVRKYLEARAVYDSIRQVIEAAIQRGTKYDEARAVYDADPASKKLNDALGAIVSDTNLRDNVAYLRAAIMFRTSFGVQDYELTARSFDALVRLYPKSEKREGAIFMSAVARMKQSKIFDPQWDYDQSLRPCPDCRDNPWRAARAGFLRVMREYPRGRYFNDARGWLAFLSHKVGDWAGALVEYYRLLGNTNVSVRLEAASSLRMVRYHASESDIREVETRLAGEPAAARAYAYHEIYNYSGTLPVNPFGPGTVSPKKREALERVTAFASRVMTRFPNAANGGRFALRAAMGNLELGNNPQASRLARRALALRVSGEDRAQALWVQAVADNQRGELAASRCDETIHC